MLQEAVKGLQRSSLRIPVIAGPTAVGKTELSVRVAEILDSEVVSADSRQIYRELTIGTAKPTPEHRARVRHHFVDELTLLQSYSAGRFASDANRRLNDILDRGRRPLIVGGSTLYLAALLHGISPIPDVPTSVRTLIAERYRLEGGEALFQELAQVDPRTADTLDPTKSQRLIRALEVFHATGQPLSNFHDQRSRSPFKFAVFVLDRDRAELYHRINERVDEMLELGLVDETRAVLNAGFDPSLNALQTIGYREVISYLNGEIDHVEMRHLIARNTRRYAKRQLTWFRRFPAYHWINANVQADELVDKILTHRAA